MSDKPDLIAKWAPYLNESVKYPALTDDNRKNTMAQVLENTYKATLQKEDGVLNMTKQFAPALLSETAPVNSIGDGTGNVDLYDPILISLTRRAMPKLIHYDIMGVQPMTGPTGLIFAMKSQYANTTAVTGEALFNEADTTFSGTGTEGTDTGAGHVARTGQGVTTANMEANTAYAEMGFTIDKVTATARSRALKAEYTTELAQDLKAIHGLNVENELANILTGEIVSAINREAVRALYTTANTGAQDNTAVAGTFNLDVDSNGRWMVEKFKSMYYQVQREANKIATNTRRGPGNFVLCSQDVASALEQAGVLDHTPAIAQNTSLNIDITASSYAGILNGRFKVFVDPYAGGEYFVVGYKGVSAWDAGLFYCPYVPLQMVRAIGEDSFQPKIGFKTRYAMVSNPFATAAGDGNVDAYDGTVGANNQNKYYRRVLIQNLM